MSSARVAYKINGKFLSFLHSLLQNILAKKSERLYNMCLFYISRKMRVEQLFSFFISHPIFVILFLMKKLIT